MNAPTPHSNQTELDLVSVNGPHFRGSKVNFNFRLQTRITIEAQTTMK